MVAPSRRKKSPSALAGRNRSHSKACWANGFSPRSLAGGSRRSPAGSPCKSSGVVAAPACRRRPEFTGEFTGEAQAPEEPLSLWYRRPAKVWTEALAIGSGRLGAMVFGGINHERLQLNEDTLWGGGPYDPNNPEALAALPEARRLVFEGKYREADQLVNQKMIAKPRGQMPYQTVGDLLLSFPEVNSVADYRRDLNLDTAISRVSYSTGGVKFTREVFASPVDQVIVVRLTADKPGRIAFSAGFRTPQQASATSDGPDTLVLSGVNGAADGIRRRAEIPGARQSDRLRR